MEQMVYLADDEQSILDVLSAFLTTDGFKVETFLDGDKLIAACERKLPQIVVLDIMMPGTDGLSVCSVLRESYPHLPIILISAKGSPYDRVNGLNTGGDDYICKPFLPIELLARIRSVLRRSQTVQYNPGSDRELSFGPLTLHCDMRTAELSGELFHLSPTEFDFLAFLMERGDTAVSREELLDTLWKVNWQADTRVADDLVKRLRKKLRARNSSLQIETVWGYGFRLVLEEQK